MNIFITFTGIFIIFRYVGTNRIGYAGIDSSFSVADYCTAINGIVSKPFSLYLDILLKLIVFLIFPFLALCFCFYRIQIKKLFWAFILLFYYLGTQFILYSKSGMFERYLIPSLFGYFFFVVVLLYDWYKGLDMPKHYEKIYFAILGILLFSVFKISDVKGAAQGYATDGVQTTEILEIVNTVSNKEENNILVCFGYEQDYAASVYLCIKYGLSNVYNVHYSDNSDGYYYRGYPASETGKNIDIENVDVFVGRSDLLDNLFYEKGMSERDMEQKEVGMYSIYKVTKR